MKTGNSHQNDNEIIAEAFDALDPAQLEVTRISLDIAERLHNILDEKNMTQKDLADLMGKRESEVSRWLKGMHNFTMKTVAKLQVALGEKILDVAGKKRDASSIGCSRNSK